ncbi:PTS sugar transporter subunit IIA [Escherichia coli]
MAALTASCIDLNIQGNGAYSILKQLATMALQNGFITDSHQFLQTLLLREKCTLLDLVPASPCRTVKAPALNNRFASFARKAQAIDWKASDGEDVNCWICLACRKAAKRIRSNHRYTVSQNYPPGFYSPTATRRRRPGVCLVKSNPQLIRKWRWSHPYVSSRSPTAPPGSLTPTWWRKPWNRKPVLSAIP